MQMRETVGVGVATFGDEVWRELGQETAKTFAEISTSPVEVVHCHESTLKEARDAVVESLDTDWIVLLDADDMLHEDYANWVSRIGPHVGNLILQPKTLAWYGGIQYDEAPDFIKPTQISQSNFLVVGSPFRKSSYLSFDGTLEALEDWDMFCNMIDAGAKVYQFPELVYIVNQRVGEESRNKNEIKANRSARIIRERNKKRNLSNCLVERGI